MDKNQLTALVAQGLSTHQIASELECSQTNVRHWLRKFGLKTAHAGRGWDDAQLVEAVRTSESMSQVMVKLRLKATAAGNRFTIKKYIHSLGLSTEHWTGQAWVGTRPSMPTQPQSLDEILVRGSTYRTHHLRKRLLASGMKEHRCERCERTEWMGSPIPLELEHVNGISDDHRLENLLVLCPNCHALTETWRGRKNGKAYKASQLSSSGRATP